MRGSRSTSLRAGFSTTQRTMKLSVASVEMTLSIGEAEKKTHSWWSKGDDLGWTKKCVGDVQWERAGGKIMLMAGLPPTPKRFRHGRPDRGRR